MKNDNPERRQELNAIIIPFGKIHRGKTIGQIFDEDPGWLDYVAGFDSDKVKSFMEKSVRAIQEYVGLPVVARRIQEVLG